MASFQVGTGTSTGVGIYRSQRYSPHSRCTDAAGYLESRRDRAASNPVKLLFRAGNQGRRTASFAPFQPSPGKMKQNRSGLKSVQRPRRSLRHKLGLKGELALAAAPTATVLIVMGFVEVLSQQRLLFASLASSAFLIYLDPQHGTNLVRTLVLAQSMAAILGWIIYSLLGPGYFAGGIAMVLTIILMIVFDAVHPPAVSTSLSFALRAGNENNLVLFGLAVGMTVGLVGLERTALWVLSRYSTR